MNKKCIFNIFKFYFSIFLFFSFFIFSSAENNQGIDILSRADFTLVPKIASYFLKLVEKSDDIENTTIFKCFKKTDLKYLFFTLKPSFIYGQAHLRIENSIWTYYPLADQMLQQSYKSAFLGTGLSYCDVMYNELIRYYDVKILDDNYIYMEKNYKNFLKNNNEPVLSYKLLLTAKKGAQGYPKAIIFIDKKNFVTLKREYYSLSDQKIKEIYFYNFLFNKNHIESFYMEVIDYIGKGYLTYAYFDNIKILDSLSDKYFSLNFIKTYTPDPDEYQDK